MQTVRERVEQYLKLVDSPPSCYPSTRRERFLKRVTPPKRTFTRSHVDGGATPRLTKRSRKQVSTSTNGVVEQTLDLGDFLQFAARLSTAYEYELDAHVRDVAEILSSEVISHYKKENIPELYDTMMSSTIKDGWRHIQITALNKA